MLHTGNKMPYTGNKIFGKYVDPINPFSSKVHWKQPVDDTKAPIEPREEAKEAPLPAVTNAKTIRAPIVPQKKRYQKRRLPGERLLRRVARIAPKTGESIDADE